MEPFGRHREHWSVMRAPLDGAEPIALLERAGVPPALAPVASQLLRHPRFVERVWSADVHWQVSDLDAPRALVQWLSRPQGWIEARLAPLALLAHAASVRRLIGGREQAALRRAAGERAWAAVFEAPTALPGEPAVDLSALDLRDITSDATGILEREGCRVLAGICEAFGPAWREVLRLRLQRRLEPMTRQPHPLRADQALALVSSLFEVVGEPVAPPDARQ